MCGVSHVTSWAPLVLTSLGFELVTAVRGALVFNLAGIAINAVQGVLLTLSGASGFFAWIAAALLIASVAVLLVRRQIAARERYFAAGASTSGA